MVYLSGKFVEILAGYVTQIISTWLSQYIRDVLITVHQIHNFFLPLKTEIERKAKREIFTYL